MSKSSPIYSLGMSTPISTTRSCTIQGGAAVFGTSKKGGKKQADPRVVKHGGGAPVMTAGVLPLGMKTAEINGYQAPTMPGQGGSALQGAPPIRLLTGGRKVELRKPVSHRKVLLNPKKYKVADSIKTRKTRKITIGIDALHRRVTRAKKIRDDVKEIPLQELRKELIVRGLIKESSKAPESILRQIASDAQIVATNGL